MENIPYSSFMISKKCVLLSHIYTYTHIYIHTHLHTYIHSIYIYLYIHKDETLIITHPHIFFEVYTKHNVVEHNMHRPNAAITLEYRGRRLCLVLNEYDFNLIPFFVPSSLLQLPGQ